MPFFTEPTEAECFEAEQEFLFDVRFRQERREIKKMIELERAKKAEQLANDIDVVSKESKQGGQKMPVIKTMGFYKESEKVGYVGWIETIDGMYFVDVDGKISKPEM